MAKSVAEAYDSMWQNLAEKTGRDRAAWVEIGRATGIAKHRDLTNHLKSEFGITHGYANAIALATLAPEGAADQSPTDQIAAMFAGPKAALRPLYDALVHLIEGFGADVEFSPKKSYVSVRRSKQFAILQPGANRIDVGLVLKTVPPEGRLEASGSFNAMLTHRVRVGTVAEVDTQLANWLRQAYDEA